MRPRTTTSSLSLTEGSCRVYQSTEFCGSDRILVVATFQVHFRSHRQSNDPKVFYVDRLKEGECAQWVCWGTLWSFSTAMQPDRPRTSVEHLQAWITRWSSRINWWMPEWQNFYLTGTTGSHRSLLHSSSDRVSQFASFPSAQDTGQFIRSLAEIIYWKISCPPKPYESWNPSPPHRWLQSTQKVARSSQILLGCRAVGVLSSIVWVVQGWSTREIEIGVRK